MGRGEAQRAVEERPLALLAAMLAGSGRVSAGGLLLPGFGLMGVCGCSGMATLRGQTRRPTGQESREEMKSLFFGPWSYTEAS